MHGANAETHDLIGLSREDSQTRRLYRPPGSRERTHKADEGQRSFPPTPSTAGLSSAPSTPSSFSIQGDDLVSLSKRLLSDEATLRSEVEWAQDVAFKKLLHGASLAPLCFPEWSETGWKSNVWGSEGGAQLLQGGPSPKEMDRVASPTFSEPGNLTDLLAGLLNDVHEEKEEARDSFVHPGFGERQPEPIVEVPAKDTKCPGTEAVRVQTCYQPMMVQYARPMVQQVQPVLIHPHMAVQKIGTHQFVQPVMMQKVIVPVYANQLQYGGAQAVAGIQVSHATAVHLQTAPHVMSLQASPMQYSFNYA
eukprot:Sspe_Gene.115148::Locus_102087_Transcript_1_1_Confidence_1.000_Length_1244::g.115148::m.115148